MGALQEHAQLHYLMWIRQKAVGDVDIITALRVVEPKRLVFLAK